jgi:hypothetical protein
MANCRRVAPLCLTLLAPSLAWAAPPDDSAADRPPVQRPSKPVSDATETTVDAQTPEAPADAAAPAESTAAEPPSTHPISADPLSEPDPAAQPEAEAQPGDKDLSNLLVSDEPEATPAPGVRTSDDRGRVDRNERLRNYYARIYRPPENPSRLWFAARGAYALAGTSEGSGGGRMGFANVELGQTWNYIGYGIGGTLLAGDLTFGEDGVEKYGGVLVGGGPSLGLGRLGLFGRGYLDLRVGYNFFYAPVSSTRPELTDPADASPHGPKVQVDVGMLLHDSESRRFRHGLGATIGWQMLVHSFTGEYPRVNSFLVGVGYFFG